MSIQSPLYLRGPTAYVPHHLHFGKEMLEKMFSYGSREALINADTEETLTFLDLSQLTVDIALSLTRAGIVPGDVISLCSEKRMEVLPVVLASFCAGAVYSSVDIAYGEDMILHRMSIAKPKLMFCSRAAFELHKSTFDAIGSVEMFIVFGDGDIKGALLFKDFVSESCPVPCYIPSPVSPTDRALILFSSGTTGQPKGVPWTHMGLLVNTNSVTNECYKNSIMLNTREWHLTYGLFMNIASLRAGSGVVFTSGNTERDWWRSVDRYRIEILQLTPNTIMDVIKSTVLDQYSLSSVKLVYSSSTPVFAEQVDALKRRLPGVQLCQIYGLTEAGAASAELLRPPRAGSVGTPSHGFLFKVVDIDTRRAVGPNVRGEICLKSPSLTPGYIGIDNRDYIDSEGFFLTGDVGYYDDDGYFYIVNRIKELIKFNDYSIAPAELESILALHPAVLEAGVGVVPRGAGGGGTPAAAVVRGGDVSEGELVRFLHDRISDRWRLAGGVIFVENLPRGAGGKLDRKALRDMLIHDSNKHNDVM